MFVFGLVEWTARLMAVGRGKSRDFWAFRCAFWALVSGERPLAPMLALGER